MVEEPTIQSLQAEIEDLKKQLSFATDNTVEMMNERDSARTELEGALLQIKDLQERLEKYRVFGPASTEGKTLHDMRGDIQRGQKPDNLDAIRKMASAGEPLIDVEGRDLIRKST